MAINLMTLEPQRISRSLKGKFVFLYGDPGIGKTTLASQFPKSLILGFEQGTNALDNVYVAQMKTWQDWKTVVGQLTKNEALKEKFETVCIDTTDMMWEMLVRKICAAHDVVRIGEIQWGQGYEEAKQEFISGLDALSKSGYGIVFISHSTEKTFKDDRGQEYTKIVPALPNRPFEVVNKMVDLVGYIRLIPVDDEGNKERFVFFRGDERFLAKSRFQYIEPKVKFSYDEIARAIQEACDKEAELHGAKASEEGNSYLELNFDELIEQAKIVFTQATDAGKVDEVSKILADIFGKPTKFSEILPQDVDKLHQALTEIKTTIL